MGEYCWGSFKCDERRRSAVKHSIARRPSLQWMLRLEPMVASCICSGRMLYASTLAGCIYGVELSGRIRWVHRCSIPIVSTPVLVEDGWEKGIIVASTFSTWLDENDGNKNNVNNNVNSVFALDADDGSMLWELSIEGDVFSSPCYADSLVIFGALDGYVYAVDAYTGRIAWRFKTGGEVWSSPAYDSKRRIIIIGSDDSNVYSLALDDGMLVWQSTLDGKVRSSSPCIASEHVFISTYSGHVYCISMDGSIEWSRRVSEHPILSSPAYSNSRVFFGSSDTYVYALDARDGSMLWRVKTNNKVWSTPAIAEGNDTLIACSLDSRVYAIDADTGMLLWVFPTMDAIDASPCICHDRIFIGSRDGVLYAFGYAPDYIR
ncbi:MAG: PQQ-binding-like beta-propeller repeat protein [Nitrososphaera sp.]|uniref:outer membrane protein assembly factor BamB family protein n=1 Tax=Candidatus Nitrosocaldus islandicus TaxID=2045011 RepID=UPI001315762D|nr:PQQ-binding-like beta-propeller repeat protein [Candidatus Nitrosocaldus islandicus]